MTLGIVASLAWMGLVLMYGRLSAGENSLSRLPGALDMKCNQETDDPFITAAWRASSDTA